MAAVQGAAVYFRIINQVRNQWGAKKAQFPPEAGWERSFLPKSYGHLQGLEFCRTSSGNWTVGR